MVNPERDNICDICKTEKREDDFILHDTPLGPVRGNICVECLKDVKRESKGRYYREHKEHCKAKMLEWQRAHKDKVRGYREHRENKQ